METFSGPVSRWTVKPLGLDVADLLPLLGIGLLGGVVSWLCRAHPSIMPVWAPWDFSWVEFLATALALWWFARGLIRTPPDERPAAWRQICFVLGIGAIYAVLQTRLDYMMQHMFFLNRIQHVVMHHFGPFLVALAWPGPTLKRGMPASLRRAVEGRAAARAMAVVQQPVVAAFLFVGLFAFWLIPPVHFRAMIDPKLYALMNWSMVVDGFLFWLLVLDPRPKPPARISTGARAALAIGVMFPQIVLGASITFAGFDLYSFYNLCGRLYPSIGALADQQLGGVVIWIPPAMMSVVALLVVLNALRRREDTTIEDSHDTRTLAIDASRWTGR
jgi:putative membrane protein